MYKNSEESKKTNILITIAVVLVSAVLMYLILSSYGLFNSYVSYDAKFAPFFMKVIGTILLAGTAFYAFTVIKNNTKGNAWSGAIVAIGLILALCFNVNFKFTGGDKQQQETVFYSNGTIQLNKLDKWIEENKELYLSHGIDITDTAFINYVKKYSELPGRNKYNALIRIKQIPASTAPRANEDFPLPKDFE